MGGGILNNRMLFTNDRLLFSLLFSGNFFGGKALLEGDKAVMGVLPSPHTRENSGMTSFRFKLHKRTQLPFVLLYGSLKIQITSHFAVKLNKACPPMFLLLIKVWFKRSVT